MSVATTGLLLIVGSVLFWGGAFMPINAKLYSQPSAEKMLEVVQEDPTGWKISNMVYILGAIVTGVGIWGLGNSLGDTAITWRKMLGFYGFFLGLLLTIGFIAQRTMEPASYILSGGAKPIMLHLSMGVMTLATMGLGLFLRESAIASWVPLTFLILGVLFVVYHFMNKDMVPMFHYVPTLVLGIYLLAKGREILNP